MHLFAKTLKTLALIATIVSLSGCGDAEPQHTAATPMTAVTGSKVTRSWGLYSRACSYADLSCSEWQTEIIPDVDTISPITAELGAWVCHSLGTQHNEDGTEQVTLWCSTEGHENQAWQVTTLCRGEDSQESITLTERETGRYYELTILCAVD